MNPPGADTTPNEGHTEWFEIYNTTSSDVVMDGWTLTDASNGAQTVIGSFTLAANSYAAFSGFNIPDAKEVFNLIISMIIKVQVLIMKVAM